MDLKTDALLAAKPIIEGLERGLRRAGQVTEADRCFAVLVKIEEALREAPASNRQ